MNLEFIQAIFSVFSRSPTLQCTIRELSKKANLSYNATYRTIEDLLKEKILQKRTFGKASVISILPNNESITLLSLAAYAKSKKQTIPIITGTRAFIFSNHQIIGICEEKKTDTILVQQETVKMITIHEWIAEVNNNNKEIKNMEILQGAEYLYTKIFQTL